MDRHCRSEGLEIGPLDKPLVPRKGNRISYLDEFPREVLVERCRVNPNRDENRVVQLDYVLDGRTISQAVDQTFDYAIASHVVEHTPNLFGWLRDIADILEPNGRLFLVIPDRRFTFDAGRPLTSLGELIENDRRGLLRPPFRAVFDQRFYRRLGTAAANRKGRKKGEELSLEQSIELEFAYDRAKKSEAAYIDVHCSVFEAESFKLSIDTSCQLGIQPFECLAPAPTTRPFLDFIALLGCPGDRPAIRAENSGSLGSATKAGIAGNSPADS